MLKALTEILKLLVLGLMLLVVLGGGFCAVAGNGTVFSVIGAVFMLIGLAGGWLFIRSVYLKPPPDAPDATKE